MTSTTGHGATPGQSTDDEIRVITIRHDDQGDSAALLGRVFGCSAQKIAATVKKGRAAIAKAAP